MNFKVTTECLEKMCCYELLIQCCVGGAHMVTDRSVLTLKCWYRCLEQAFFLVAVALLPLQESGVRVESQWQLYALWSIVLRMIQTVRVRNLTDCQTRADWECPNEVE